MTRREDTEEETERRYPENIWVMAARMTGEAGETGDTGEETWGSDPMTAWMKMAAAYLDHVRSQGRLPALTLAVPVHRMFVAAPVCLGTPDGESGPPDASPMEMTILAAAPWPEPWRIQRDVDRLLGNRDLERTVQARRSQWSGTVTVRDIAEALAMVDAGSGGAAVITFHHGPELEGLYGRPRMAELRRRILRKKIQVEMEERARTAFLPTRQNPQNRRSEQ